ncbi:factor of DNA methylation 1-like isoform X2 [Malania oleifera]|uniref:factor of DNA methylation 1-like isoform X2 n=1 Tax=Malania oleifera TaxID=397392 RepID=UPI0025ADAE64|nr:factor of DNA methylation 1-like isoform X2 [Malania oleifera]XP_057978968.1 factor of DNA methylation 1-like isoform X2 [Malania oleifera]
MESQILEELKSARNLVVSLAKEIDVKNQKLLVMERKNEEISTSLRKMTEDNAKMYQAYISERRKVQLIELENLKQQQSLMIQRKELEQYIEKLEKREAQLDFEQKNQLEKKKLESENFEESNSSSIIQINALRKELAEKADELQFVETLSQTLILKEHMSNHELQDARKELMSSLQDFWNSQTTIGIKRMGEINQQPFKEACLQKFSGGDWEMKSLELSSLWQEYVKNPSWHPFKKKVMDGKLQEVIDEDDGKLKELRGQWGEAVHKAVTKALLELNEYNSSGGYVVPELWNFKEGRKASVKEVVQCVIHELKALKSSKRRR